MKMNNVIVNRTMSRMLLKEDKKSIPGRCRVIKRERENFTDSIGSGATKRDIPKQRQTIERECDWIEVDADELRQAQAVNKERKDKIDRLKADEKAELEQSQKYYEGEPDKNGMVMISKNALDSMLDRISPEDIDLEETEQLTPAELRKRRSEKALLAKQKTRDKNSQHRREKWTTGVLGESEIGEGSGAPSKKITITIKAKKDEVEEAKKKEKKNCSPGNSWHDKNGRWTDKKNAASFSLQFMPGGKDCRGGVARMPGQKFTKLPCGRQSKHSKKKAPHKCSDGSPSS
jgi:hypothetical protein